MPYVLIEMSTWYIYCVLDSFVNVDVYMMHDVWGLPTLATVRLPPPIMGLTVSLIPCSKLARMGIHQIDS